MQQRFDDKHSSPKAPYTLPDHRVLRVLMDLTNRHDLDYANFCEAVEEEPAITSRIMRAARAIRAGRENGVEELRHAIAIIGLRRVQEILMSIEGELRRSVVLD